MTWVDSSLDRHPSPRYRHRLADAVALDLTTDVTWGVEKLTPAEQVYVVDLVRWMVIDVANRLAEEDREKRERSEALQGAPSRRGDGGRPSPPSHNGT